MTTTHRPAVKVAGRRLSLTNRSKPSAHIVPAVAAEKRSEDAPASPVDDYPRPTSQAHQERPRHDLDYAPYEEAHKHKGGEPHAPRVPKAGETVIPGSHEPVTKKEVVRGGRIVQPAGKGLGL